MADTVHTQLMLLFLLLPQVETSQSSFCLPRSWSYEGTLDGILRAFRSGGLSLVAGSPFAHIVRLLLMFYLFFVTKSRRQLGKSFKETEAGHREWTQLQLLPGTRTLFVPSFAADNSEVT